jgi:excisionase family DNA binding protein
MNPTAPLPERYLTTEAVAQVLDCSISTVHRYVHAEGLPAYRIGRGKYRFDPRAVADWVQGRQIVVESQAPPEYRPRQRAAKDAHLVPSALWDGIDRLGDWDRD